MKLVLKFTFFCALIFFSTQSMTKNYAWAFQKPPTPSQVFRDFKESWQALSPQERIDNANGKINSYRANFQYPNTPASEFSSFIIPLLENYIEEQKALLAKEPLHEEK